MLAPIRSTPPYLRALFCERRVVLIRYFNVKETPPPSSLTRVPTGPSPAGLPVALYN
jgi:hypothetical protein